MLGLNISSAFNSVITVYILIPLLIIPQLILSGVVVSFDKLNSSFSDNEKVPLIGEIMASRWAYEAIAITQYRDNPFKENYFNLERRVGQNTYKSLYYIKFLEEELEYCRANLEIEETEDRLKLLSKEISKELEIFGKDKFLAVNRINIDEFDEEVYLEAKNFLKTLRGVYNSRRKDAKNELDQLLEEKTKDKTSETAYLAERNAYENERIDYMLKNIITKKRLVVSNNNEVVQKIYPIYARNENPNNFLDFRTNFYYPEKYFFGYYFDTKVFNTIIIWSMTIALIIILYYDVLRKLITRR